MDQDRMDEELIDDPSSAIASGNNTVTTTTVIRLPMSLLVEQKVTKLIRIILFTIIFFVKAIQIKNQRQWVLFTDLITNVMLPNYTGLVHAHPVFNFSERYSCKNNKYLLCNESH